METFISLAVLLILVLGQHFLIIKTRLSLMKLRTKCLRSSNEYRAYVEFLERGLYQDDQIPMVRQELLGRTTL